MKRDAYSEVGTQTREMIHDALADEQVTDADLRVVLAIVHELTSWSRTSERVSRQRMVDLTHRHSRTVQRSVARLSDLGIIGYRAGAPGRVSRYSLRRQPDVSTEGRHPDASTGDTQMSPQRRHLDVAPSGHPDVSHPRTGSEHEARNQSEHVVDERLRKALAAADDPTSLVAKVRPLIIGATHEDLIALLDIEDVLWTACKPDHDDHDDHDWDASVDRVDELTNQLVAAIHAGHVDGTDDLAVIAKRLITGVGDDPLAPIHRPRTA